MKKIYEKAKFHGRLMILTEICVLSLALFAVIIIIVSFATSNKSVVKIIGNSNDKNNDTELQKRFMTNPRLEIEDKDSFYNIKADRGYYETRDKIVFEKATIDSNLGELKANEVIIENNFTDITIKDNPELIIYPDNISTD